MCYSSLGYEAISFNGEGYGINESKTLINLVENLVNKYSTIIINYDNDEAGIRGANKLKSQIEKLTGCENKLSLMFFPTDLGKDLTEVIKIGVSETQKLLEKCLKTSVKE